MHQQINDNYIKNISIPNGKFYGPCSGKDVRFAIEHFGSKINNFVFCDVSYRFNTFKNVRYLPKCFSEWELISRKLQPDKSKSIKKNPNSNNNFHVSCTIDEWRRPDGTNVIIEFWCDLAEDVLISQFETNSISVFMHINDGEGEGGSNLWFLASKEYSQDEFMRKKMFLSDVVDRLVEGALIITDGKLSDPRFESKLSFNSTGRLWKYLDVIKGNRATDRKPSLWRMSDYIK